MQLTLCTQVRLVRDDGTGDVHLPAKALALLAFLSLERGVHARDRLSALLWGESPEDKAHASLRQSLTQLRAVLPDECLRIERTSVSLADGLGSDVGTFLRLAEAGDEGAVEVDIPRFLVGLPLRDCPAFEEWAEATRETLHRTYRIALTRAAQGALARRDFSRALALAAKWQALDPLSDEAAHYLVEVLFLRAGRDPALAAWREYRDRLKRETGKAPGLALRELAARLEDARGTATPTRVIAVGKAHHVPALDGGLVGRESEWEQLVRAWHATAEQGSRIVLVEGEPGVGKTRLADEFLRLLAVEGATVLRGRAFEAGLDVPFGPVLEIVRGAIDAPGAAGTDATWLAEVSRVAPELRRRFPSLADAPGAAGGQLLHEGVAQLLLAVADETRLAIAVDDVQWCDADSCNLLHYLARRLDGTPILWFVSCTLGATDRDAPAARLVRALRAMPGSVRLRLGPLDLDGVWRLIRELGRVTHPTGARRLAGKVYEVTGGNPLYVMELLKTLFARGWLAADPATGAWRQTTTGDEELATSEMFPEVREAIAERVAALPDEQHALLLTIAVSGRGCHTGLLSYVHGISRLRAAHICDALVERFLVTESEGRYACAHAVIAGVVRDGMSTARRREVHRMIALALVDAAAGSHEAVDHGAVARHAAAGEEWRLAHAHAMQASAGCVARGAWVDALAWLDVASSSARTAEETSAADRATAELLGHAGWSAPPERRASGPGLQLRDVDLTPREGVG